jgi:hypothetical protein
MLFLYVLYSWWIITLTLELQAQLGQDNLGNKLGVHLRQEMKCYQTKWKNVGGKGKDSSHLQGALGIHKELWMIRAIVLKD